MFAGPQEQNIIAPDDTLIGYATTSDPAEDRGATAIGQCGAEWNAEFIVHARQDLPDALAEIARQQADLTRLAEVGKERPMDSAPKDGTEVLLRVKLRAGIPGKWLVGHYMAGGHCIDDHPPIDRGWYFWNGCMFDKASEPIAWLPLPEDAKEAARE